VREANLLARGIELGDRRRLKVGAATPSQLVQADQDVRALVVEVSRISA